MSCGFRFLKKDSKKNFFTFFEKNFEFFVFFFNLEKKILRQIVRVKLLVIALRTKKNLSKSVHPFSRYSVVKMGKIPLFCIVIFFCPISENLVRK